MRQDNNNADDNTSKAYWLSFAISRYARSKNLTPDVAFPILRKFGVIDFLDRHYETEHLENIIYVIEDMDNILKRNGGVCNDFICENEEKGERSVF